MCARARGHSINLEEAGELIGAQLASQLERRSGGELHEWAASGGERLALSLAKSEQSS